MACGRAGLAGVGTGPPGLGHDVLTAQAASASGSLGVGLTELDNEPAPEHPGRLVPGDVRRQRTVAAQLRVADDHVRGELASRDQRNPLHDGAVTLTGTIEKGGFGQVNVVVDGMPGGVVVSVQTGPALTGTALRDVTGQTTFDMFENQIDYAQVGLSLNEPLKAGVLAENDLASMVGRRVTVVGAFAYSDPAHIVVTPVSVEVAS